MLSSECLRELRSSWLPNLTDVGLNRAIRGLLDPGAGGRGTLGLRAASEGRAAAAMGSRGLAEVTRFVRRARFAGGLSPRSSMAAGGGGPTTPAPRPPGGPGGPAGPAGDPPDGDGSGRSSAA